MTPGNTLAERLTEVKTKWHSIAQRDAGQSIFGAFMHHYQLNKPLSEEELLNFENKYKFKLYEEYREYLKQVSNGGVGPFYGMYPLQESIIALNSGSRDEGNFINYLEKNPDHFAKPFPVTDDEINNYLLQKIKNPKDSATPIRLDSKAGGYMFISEYGGGGYYIMPVNGNGAGEIWFLQKMSGNKLTFELTDEAGNLVKSGSYGDDGDDSYFELYPQVKWNNAEISTVNFLEWLEHKQTEWFKEEEENEIDNAGCSPEEINNENSYYPLSVGNKWVMNFGETQIVTSIENYANGEFTTLSSFNGATSSIKKVNNNYYGDSFEKGNFQFFLKDNLAVGDSWENNFKANTLDCIYIFTVKELLDKKTVGNTEYKDVVMIELDSYYVINGTRMSMNSFTQNYYAKGVGPILTTTSGVIGTNVYPLLSYELN